MRLVAFGFLAALVGAGCALQAGDPGDDPTSPSSEVRTAEQTGPKVHSATVSPAASINPEPSPWAPVADIKVDNDSTDPNDSNGPNGQNPEPSPWKGSLTTGGVGDPQSGSAGGTTTGASGGSTPNKPGHSAP
jgi:hypothetical protein